MQTSRKDISKTQVELKIVVDAKTINKHHNAVVKRLAPEVKVPGFRAGKAPLEMIEKQLDDERLQTEVVDTIIQDSASQAVREQEIRYVSQPQVTLDKYVPKTELEFTLKLDVLPPVKLPDYTKLKHAKPEVKVADKEVTDVINNLRERAAERKEVKRAAKDGDEVIINFEGFDSNDKPIAGGKGNNYPLKLGSDSFIPGFEAGLIGKKAGESTTIKLTFPKDYNVKSLSGKKARFEVEVKKVTELVLPKADDAFAAKIGPFKSVDELKKDIREQLKAQKTQEAVGKAKDEIVTQLVKKTSFELPQVLVDEQLKAIEDQFKQDLTYRGITLKEYLDQEKLTEETWRKDKLTPEAEQRVRVGVVLAEVANKEQVTVTEKDLSDRLTAMKQQYTNPEAAAQLDQPDTQRDIANRLMTEKTVDLLYDKATK